MEYSDNLLKNTTICHESIIYNIILECPECSQKGEFRISENDYPFMIKLDTYIDCINGRFEISMIDNMNARIAYLNYNHIFEH